MTDQVELTIRSSVLAPHLATWLNTGGPLRYHLTKHRAIHYMERGPDDWTFRTANELAIATVASRLRVSSCLAMREAAIAGLDIAMLPTFHCSAGLKSGAMEPVDVGADEDITPITLAYPHETKPSAKLAALIEH